MYKKQENGYILVTVILLLMVLTVLGMAALGTSTIENMLSGNMLIDEQHDPLSESPLPFLPATIPPIMVESTIPSKYSNVIKDPNFYIEIRSIPYAFNTMTYSMSDPIDAGPDFQIQALTDGGNVNTVDVDVDKLETDAMEGGGKINHNCYKGAGKCAGKGSVYYYRVNSRAYNAAIGSESITASYYRYVDK